MTNVPVKAISDIEVKAEVSADDKILILDSVSEEARLASKSELKWDPWEDGKDWKDGTNWTDGKDGKDWVDGNWISSITSSKAWKITTVTITETNGDSESFQISDGADWVWSGDVLWPNSSTDGDVVLFDGTTGKIIKDSGVKLGTAASKDTGTSSGNIPVLDNTGKLSTSVVPDVHTDAVTSVNGSTGAVTVSEFTPWGTATTGYVVKKTANWYEWSAESWAVTSVNGNTWAVTVSEFAPSNSGSADQILTKTSWGYQWANAPTTWIANVTTGTTTTVTGIRAGTEAEYGDITTPSASVLYFTF